MTTPTPTTADRIESEIRRDPARTLEEIAGFVGCTREWVRRVLREKPDLDTTRRRALLERSLGGPKQPPRTPSEG